MRTFMFLGFAPVSPVSGLVPACSDQLFMAYTIEESDSDHDGGGTGDG